MKKIILLQPSLRKNSLTAEILKEFQNMLLKLEAYKIETIDLREKELEFCDGRELSAYNPDLQEIHQKLKSADIVILGFPIYHYSISGVLKNLLDICGEALTGKRVGVIISSILPDCHMAYEHFFESFEKKYSIEAITEVPYVLN
jgi:NAD(P)H-dependent FMN reductase